ncbi:MAG: MEDS domain-containing protein [Dehalococcoidia bacterium]
MAECGEAAGVQQVALMQHDDGWLERGAHVCHIATGRNDAKSILLPFLHQSLLNNEFCLFVTGDESPDDWYFELQAFGIDVADRLLCGALRVIDRREWRPATGSLRSLAQAGKAYRLVPWTRFNGARIVYDAAWAMGPDVPAEDLCHWEATATLLFEGLPVRAICQYNLETHSPRVVDGALRTHPLVLMGQTLVENPHCEAEQILEFEPVLNYSSATADEVARMLSEIHGAGSSPSLARKTFLKGP